MGISSIYRRLALISPSVEILLRKLYWKNVKLLKRFSPYAHKKEDKEGAVSDFNKVLDYLRSQGIGKGSLLVVHSSYSALEPTGLTANQIIDTLLDLVGPEGTLAMPAIRRFKEAPRADELLKTDLKNLVCTYNVKKTMVQSGVLPFMMLRRPDSFVSHHPLNPLVAIGPLAKEMMLHNLDGEKPSPHGPNSCWKYCYDHDAFVIGLGVDLDHYNTISHVNEEAFGNWKWTDEQWYRDRRFCIIDEDGNKNEVTVHERKPEWGMLRFAEINANRDRNQSGLIHREIVDGIVLCVEKAKDYVDYLQSNTKKGIFYYR